VGTVTYDSFGNTATIGAQTLLYDGGDRHTATRVGGAEVVRYGRDATGRITSRTEGASVVHYGSAGPGDSASFTMDAANTVTERTIGLVAGVLLTKRGGLIPSNDVWSYPNIHGDVMATANLLGVKQASFTYDPFGNGSAPDNSAGNLDYGWLGQHQRPLEHAGTLATIEMGARQYLPSIGRFLEVDPVEGGSANAYDYSRGDPQNLCDLDGRIARGCFWILKVGWEACSAEAAVCLAQYDKALTPKQIGKAICAVVFARCMAKYISAWKTCLGGGDPEPDPGPEDPDPGPEDPDPAPDENGALLAPPGIGTRPIPIPLNPLW
jgi:RHS repeat-associated protein